MKRLWVWVVPRPDEFAYFILGGQPTGSESGGARWKIYLFTAVWIVLSLVFLSSCLILCYDLRGCQQDAPFPQIPPQAAIAIVACGGAPRLVCEVSTCRDKLLSWSPPLAVTEAGDTDLGADLWKVKSVLAERWHVYNTWRDYKRLSSCSLS